MFAFLSECLEKFGDGIGGQIWDAVNECFDVMPIAATVDDKVRDPSRACLIIMV